MLKRKGFYSRHFLLESLFQLFFFGLPFWIILGLLFLLPFLHWLQAR